MKTIQTGIDVMESWIGYLEKKNGTDLGDMTDAGKVRNAGKANYTLYAKWYREHTGENYQGQPYCAMAVSMSFVEAYGITAAKQLLGGDLFYNCEAFYQRIRKKYPNRLHQSPKKGDVILFYNGTRHYHTGLVTKINQTGSVTVEANTSSGNDIVVPNGGATVRKSYKKNVNAVFYRPPYAEYGIAENAEAAELKTYPISTGQRGLIVTASSLRVRSLPDTSAAIVGGLKKGDAIYPGQKAFDGRGVRWYHVPTGWVSGAYLTGWILEGGNNRWWYLQEGGKWPSGCLIEVEGKIYAFDDSGYMVTEEITVSPDQNGALHL